MYSLFCLPLVGARKSLHYHSVIFLTARISCCTQGSTSLIGTPTHSWLKAPLPVVFTDVFIYRVKIAIEMIDYVDEKLFYLKMISAIIKDWLITRKVLLK